MKFVLLFLLATSIGFSAFSQNFIGDQKDLKAIMKKAEDFSKAVMNGETEKLVNAYTEDAKLFPTNREILTGSDSLRAYWTFAEGSSISYHKLTPLEIKIVGNEAYDYGYFEGTSVFSDGSESSWQGKYVVIWRKVEGEWKMYLDIWNSSPKRD